MLTLIYLQVQHSARRLMHNARITLWPSIPRSLLLKIPITLLKDSKAWQGLYLPSNAVLVSIQTLILRTFFCVQIVGNNITPMSWRSLSPPSAHYIQSNEQHDGPKSGRPRRLIIVRKVL